MDKYLITLDLDGTTLCDDKTIHRKTVDVLDKVAKMGHKVVISTGRPFYSSSQYYQDLNLDTIIVNRNGAHIHSPFDNHLDLSSQLKIETIRKITNSPYGEFILHMYIEDKKNLYVQKGNFDILKGRNYQFNQVLYKNCDKDCTMATLYVSNDKVEGMMNYLKELNDIDAYPWIHHGEYDSTMIEIFPKGVNKVQAIKKLCDYYKISVEHTIAIGDEVNDIEMIKYAKIGVAVKNANQLVKDQADILLDYTNNEGAVGIFLEEFFR